MRKLISNVSWIILYNIYSAVLALIVSIFVSRYLGPEYSGKIEYVTSIITIATTISGLGLSNIILLQMKKKPEDTGCIWGSALFIRLISSLIVYIVVFVYSFWAKDSVTVFMLRIQGVSLVFRISLLFNEWFLATLSSKNYMILNMISLTAGAVLRFALIYFSCSIKWFACAPVVEGLIAFATIFWLFLKEIKYKLRVSVEYILFLIGQSRYYIFSDIAVVIYGQIDKIMLSNMLGDYEVGIYTTASYMSTAWQIIPLAIINTFRASILSRINDGRETFEDGMKKVIVVVTLVCILGIAALFLAGRMAINILYGKEFDEASNYLFILGFSVFFSMYGCIGSIWIVASEASYISAYRTICGAFLNILLNYLLIPKWGIWGASIATLFTQIVAAVVCTAVFKETRELIGLTVKAYRHPVKAVFDEKY